MRYIQKEITPPQFFIDDTIELKEQLKNAIVKDKKKVWDNEYKNKRVLKKYLLESEQNWLCGYCEAKLKETFDREEREKKDLIHIEHIKPKHLDSDNLTFDYYNLLVSCSGKCFTDKNQPLTCGHKKGDKFDEVLFLDPTKIKDIREYFIYTNEGYIGASSKNKERAIYTMKLLELDIFNNQLHEARQIALEEFRESISKHIQKTKIPKYKIIKKLLDKENLAFISFLRFRHKNILEK